MLNLGKVFFSSLRVSLHHGPEVEPWKMAFSMFQLDGPTSMVWFLEKWIYKAFGPLTRCKPNVDQEEWPCIKKWMCWFFWNTRPKRVVLKDKNLVWPFFCLLLGFTCRQFLLNVLKMCLQIFSQQFLQKKNEQFNLYVFNVIYMWHVPCVVHSTLFATHFTMCTQILEF